MQLCKVQLENRDIRVGLIEDGHITFLDMENFVGIHCISDVLHSPKPAETVRDLFDDKTAKLPLSDVSLLAPMDKQEIWAAGVTYIRSKTAREEESEGAAQFYDMVYTADRPELFFKASPHRVSSPGGKIRIRKDSKWNVPEPELGLVLSPQLELVGYTIGNDMSSRDIEGTNPLYLPQAKVYDNCCAIGPVITLAEAVTDPKQIKIKLTIERFGTTVFEGDTGLDRMARTFDDLIGWLGRDNSFPNGVILLTGTGIVPPDDFTLEEGDRVSIEASHIGRLTNIVEQKT